MTTSPTTAAPIDGRTARAVRTKDAIVTACLDLIDEGDLRPTGPRIADRAGVSVRSVFQHFDDLDALFMAVGEKVAARTASRVAPIDPHLPLVARVDAFAAQRAEVLEGLTPILKAALAHAGSSPVIRQQFDDGHRFLRAQVEATFATELAASPEAGALAHGLVVACSWPAWNVLRGPEGLDVAASTAVVRWQLLALLASSAAGLPT
jgi:AcrR family transcriptional regulator